MKATKLVLAMTLLAGLTLPAWAEKNYTGPRPAKADVPYLQHADHLIEVEAGTAQETHAKDSSLYTVNGATATARTPVPEPIFLFQSDRVNPEHLTLYKMAIKDGQRTLAISDHPGNRKNGPKPVFILVTPLAPRLFKVEVNEILESGEYCLSPEGSNTVYCFSEY